MSTRKLLKGLQKIQDKVAESGPDENTEAEIACLSGIVKIYKAQLQYEKIRFIYPESQVRRYAPSIAVSGKDRRNLDKAIAASRQIGKRLRELHAGTVLR